MSSGRSASVVIISGAMQVMLPNGRTIVERITHADPNHRPNAPRSPGPNMRGAEHGHVVPVTSGRLDLIAVDPALYWVVEELAAVRRLRRRSLLRAGRCRSQRHRNSRVR